MDAEAVFTWLVRARGRGLETDSRRRKSRILVKVRLALWMLRLYSPGWSEQGGVDWRPALLISYSSLEEEE